MTRDTSRYNFRIGRTIVHTGITNDLERREREHQRSHGGGQISQVGPKVTRESAKKWEQEQRERGKPV